MVYNVSVQQMTAEQEQWGGPTLTQSKSKEQQFHGKRK